MSALTEYRRPVPRYGRAALAKSPWRARGGWYLHADGSWRLVYGRASSRARVARRAVCESRGGLWFWRVEEFDLSTRAVRRTVARAAQGRLVAQQAFPFADLAARTAD